MVAFLTVKLQLIAINDHDNDVDDNNGIVGEASKADIGPLMAKEKGWIEFSSGWLP